tara:strand:+ start:544 stop:732 length:189 start_codon:yes stop_codon:yes gene_type:complete
MKFRDLPIGATFDFINSATPSYNSFFERCTKISPRQYQFGQSHRAQVGSINVEVFNVEIGCD